MIAESFIAKKVYNGFNRIYGKDCSEKDVFWHSKRGRNIEMAGVEFKIIESLGTLSTSPSGWTKELNLISWNEDAPKYDLRQWSPDHLKMGKGITLSREEAEELKKLLQNRI